MNPPTRPFEEIAALRRERRRLQELLQCYREMHFDALVPDCRSRIEQLSRAIREAEGRRQKA